MSYSALNETHDILLPYNLFLLGTESSNCPNVASSTTQAWFRGTRYAHDILMDLNHQSTGWIDWNLLLDENGGPNHLGNACDAPLLVDDTGKDFIIQPMYYFIKHLSHFILPGAVRIAVETSIQYDKPGEAQLVDGLKSTVHHCDASARQQWEWTKDDKLTVSETDFCLTNVDGKHIEVWTCWDTNTQRWKYQNNTLINVQDNSCLTRTRKSLQAAYCEEGNYHQQWSVVGKEIQVNKTTATCLSAGDQMHTTSAFQTEDGMNILVILNENTVPLDIVLQDSIGKQQVNIHVPAQGINTFTWDT